MDVFTNVLHFGEEAVRFLVFGVGIGYIARKVVADYMIRKGRVFIAKTERNSAIWKHYQLQAQGKGHDCASVLDCGQDRCKVFGGAPLSV